MQSIVIDREYGIGGREVARILSERLGVEFYDGNLLVLAGKEYGIELGVLQEYDEKGVGGVLSDIAMMSASTTGGYKQEEAYSVYSAHSGWCSSWWRRGRASSWADARRTS